jgi:pimeloyl-ACP methyl ester carboxylesterase
MAMSDTLGPGGAGSGTTDDVRHVQRLLEGAPDVVVPVPGTHRTVAADVDGDPSGTPVVLVHGTPDSRLARHPDPSIAARLGVGLIAVDRPGFGRTTVDPDATPLSFAADVTALLDHLGIESAHLLAWSAGTIWTLGAAAAVPGRVRSVTAVGGLVPYRAFSDPAVREAAGDARIGMIETAEEFGASIAAAMIAPLLVPDPATPEAALEHRAEAGDPALSAVPAADVQMAAAICDAVRAGPAGLVRDVTVQLGPSGVDLGSIDVPTRFVTGVDDVVCPPAFARWYAAQIPRAEADIVAGAGHGLLLTHWHDILARIVDPASARLP